MLEPGDDDPFALVHSYFRSEPFADNDIIVYDGEDGGQRQDLTTGSSTPLHDTITACLERGLTLDHFAEYPTNISSEEFDRYEDREAQRVRSAIRRRVSKAEPVSAYQWPRIEVDAMFAGIRV